MSEETPIEHFVRNALGCTCPPEVFAEVDDQPGDAGNGKTLRRIAIGGRLLIYLVDDIDPPSPARIAGWVRQGRRERDQLGMNRFRLVFASDDPVALAAPLKAAFRSVPEVDERVHLHVVERAAIAGL